tara:strand:+ start:1922 stop:2083 length:162 start_codon:yes stop_codon:yes gene_type:complete
MNCLHCGTEMICGGNHDAEEEDYEAYVVSTNFSCSKCDSFAEFYSSKKGWEGS